MTDIEETKDSESTAPEASAEKSSETEASETGTEAGEEPTAEAPAETPVETATEEAVVVVEPEAPAEGETDEAAGDASPADADSGVAVEGDAAETVAPEPAPESAAEPAAEPEPAIAPPPLDKGPAKAKLKELKAQRDAALESGDSVALKRTRAKIRRHKRSMRKAG